MRSEKEVRAALKLLDSVNYFDSSSSESGTLLAKEVLEWVLDDEKGEGK